MLNVKTLVGVAALATGVPAVFHWEVVMQIMGLFFGAIISCITIITGIIVLLIKFREWSEGGKKE